MGGVFLCLFDHGPHMRPRVHFQVIASHFCPGFGDPAFRDVVAFEIDQGCAGLRPRRGIFRHGGVFELEHDVGLAGIVNQFCAGHMHNGPYEIPRPRFVGIEGDRWAFVTGQKPPCPPALCEEIEGQPSEHVMGQRPGGRHAVAGLLDGDEAIGIFKVAYPEPVQHRVILLPPAGGFCSGQLAAPLHGGLWCSTVGVCPKCGYVSVRSQDAAES